MPVVITPADVHHAAYSGMAPLDPANGTEIADQIQLLSDSILYNYNRLGAYRLEETYELKSDGFAQGSCSTISTVTGALWSDLAPSLIMVGPLLAGDIIEAEAMFHAEMSAGGTGAVRFGGDTLGAMGDDTWVHVPESSPLQSHTLIGRGVVAAPSAAISLSLSAGIITGGTLLIKQPLIIRARLWRAN